MYFYDYKCKNCDKIFELVKHSILDIFKDKECPYCGSKNIFRKYGDIVFDICEGKAGNSRTGYQTGIVKHPSCFGRFKGKKIKVNKG